MSIRDFDAFIRESAGLGLTKRLGIAKSKHGRWRDFTPRRKIVVAMQQDGASWADMAEYLSKVDGYAI
mgnify:CR=1 FL=1